MDRPVYEVSQINAYMKNKLDADPFLSSVCVRGELSNYKIYPSGHHYFTMKDAGGALKCVMFSSSASRLRFQPKDGMKVLASGQITVYPRDGVYQLNCRGLLQEGVGDLHMAYEQLKAKLYAEGLFDPERKKPLPPFPHRVAIITSPAGDALHDILYNLNQRYPLTKAVVMGVRVQGAEAPRELVGAIRYANRHRVADLIITGRGGGSIEDLWAFNDEHVARAIYASELPVVSAVGHEPDVTIADFVADRRATTPTKAGEVAVPDQVELRSRLENQHRRMLAALERTLKLSRQRLEALAARRVLQSPVNYIEDRRQTLDGLNRRLCMAQGRLLERKRSGCARLAASLDAMSPLKVLDRGYSVARVGEKLLRSVRDVKTGDELTLRLPDGTVRASVTDTREDEKNG